MRSSLKIQLKKLSSISKLFAFSDNPCELDQNGYYQLKCITETCVNCTLVKPFAKEDFAECGDISFHQFVVETYPIKNKAGETIRNKDGKERIGSRTVQKTFVERFEEFEVNLYSSQKAYLLHQFECHNDQFHWSIIENNGLGMTFHMDFSENISNTPKEEPQDSHFGAGSTQISLHCTVVHPAENSDIVKYSYHLSNDRGHDTAYTCVIENLLSEFGEFKDFEVI